ncbi:MAG: HNH endonuclease, partial [Candidatus Dormibacteraeota bacterium]|nr:HNH endonuclease [Candidatus Dormibacteraeota bacterium]
QLESLPKVAAALRSGEIGYQSVSILCHLRDKLGEKRDLFNEEEMLGFARDFSVPGLRRLCVYAFHVTDPDGFFNEAEENYDRRRLHISQMSDGMYVVDGLLDPVTGASLKTAAEALAKRKGPEDERTHSQRMHDAVGDLVDHALGQGTMPRRNGVKPHVNLTTTIEGLKNEVGAPPADLELSLPISTRTLERIACDSTVSRVLLADSMVIDVGRATRVVSAPTRRALRARDRGCRWPGCDRQVDWSTPHHIVAWSTGGPTRLPNLVLLCFYHHRLVHEGGWQVIRSSREFRFLPPDRVVIRRVRGPGMRWAA